MKACLATGIVQDDMWKRVSAAKPGLSKSLVSLTLQLPASASDLEAMFTDAPEAESSASSFGVAAGSQGQVATSQQDSQCPSTSAVSSCNYDSREGPVRSEHLAEYTSVSNSLSSYTHTDGSQDSIADDRQHGCWRMLARQQIPSATEEHAQQAPADAAALAEHARAVLWRSGLLVGARQASSTPGQGTQRAQSSTGAVTRRSSPVQQVRNRCLTTIEIILMLRAPARYPL